MQHNLLHNKSFMACKDLMLFLAYMAYSYKNLEEVIENVRRVCSFS